MRIPLPHSITIKVSEPEMNLIKHLAKRHNISRAEAIRVCIDHYQIIEANRYEKFQNNGDSEHKKSPHRLVNEG